MNDTVLVIKLDNCPKVLLNLLLCPIQKNDFSDAAHNIPAGPDKCDPKWDNPLVCLVVFKLRWNHSLTPACEMEVNSPTVSL